LFAPLGSSFWRRSNEAVEVPWHRHGRAGRHFMAADTFRGLFDDASLFPPASLTMPEAVAGHLRHQQAWYGEMSGPFVCADTKITQLSAALTAANVAELDLALVLPNGADSLDGAVDTVFADPRLRLRAVEVPVDRQAADTEAAVARLIARLDAAPMAGATAFAEIPAGQLTSDAVHALSEHRYPAKLRTGGVTAEAFPDEQTLARCLVLLADQRLAFKCTAGLHHAVRHRAADTGFEHHGFLNVLLAAAAALEGAEVAAVAHVLADQNAAHVANGVSELTADAAADARSLFTSFGTCSTDEPITDLVTLGLISKG
jgi:hypothetical protein